MKLTPELLAQASAGLNPIKERQLDLRGEPRRQLSTLSLTHCCRSGYKIPTIENLGVTRVCAFDFVCLTLMP
jgi:U2 small nuclear ribonucleoprotein A'